MNSPTPKVDKILLELAHNEVDRCFGRLADELYVMEPARPRVERWERRLEQARTRLAELQQRAKREGCRWRRVHCEERREWVWLSK